MLNPRAAAFDPCTAKRKSRPKEHRKHVSVTGADVRAVQASLIGPAQQRTGLSFANWNDAAAAVPLGLTGRPNGFAHWPSSNWAPQNGFQLPPTAAVEWLQYDTAQQAAVRGPHMPFSTQTQAVQQPVNFKNTAPVLPPPWTGQPAAGRYAAQANPHQRSAAVYQPHPRNSWIPPHCYGIYQAGQQEAAQAGNGNIKAYNSAYRRLDVGGNQVSEAQIGKQQEQPIGSWGPYGSETRQPYIVTSVLGGPAEQPPAPDDAINPHDPAWTAAWMGWMRDAIIVDGWKKLSWRQIGHSIDARTGALTGGPMELAWSEYGSTDRWPAHSLPDVIIEMAAMRFQDLYLGPVPLIWHHQLPTYEPIYKIALPSGRPGRTRAPMWLY